MCDGIWQCPGGDDEHLANCGEQQRCSGLFRCTIASRKVCIQPTEVCNGKADCSSREDELLCELPNKCPEKCNCLLYAIKCTQTTILSQNHVKQILYHRAFVELNQVLTLVELNHMIFQNNLVLFLWKDSNLVDVCIQFNFSSSLQLLDFS